ERHARATKGVGLDGVGARGEILAMDVQDHVWPCSVENLRTVFAPQVVPFDRKRSLVDHGPHSAVENEDTLRQDVGERLKTLLGCEHKRCASLILAAQLACLLIPSSAPARSCPRRFRRAS